MNLPLNDPTSNPALRPLPCSLLVFFFLLFLPPKRASSFDKAKIRRFSMNTRETFSFFDAKSHWADRSKAILKFVSWLLLYGAGGKTGVACLKLFEWNGKNFSNSIRIWRDTMIGSRVENPFPSKQLLSSFLLARRKRDNPQRSYAFPAFPRKRLMGEEEEEGVVGA